MDNAKLVTALGREPHTPLDAAYPRETPQGDQVDLNESIDVAGGRITRHRVYWGWVGFKTLVAAMKRAEPAT
ncbi:hypothetical protein WT08_07320 [Burkholderia sp. MSMB1552]|nr:hypothetical protein WT08_07320 [Burkholderia sp. MSMB1552]KWZ51432.1 hypothetical protein WS92_19290 [Burkholderia sp. MSMB1588]